MFETGFLQSIINYIRIYFYGFQDRVSAGGENIGTTH